MSPLAFCSGPFWPDALQLRRAASEELLRQTACRLADALPAAAGAMAGLSAALRRLAQAAEIDGEAWCPSVGDGLSTAARGSDDDRLAAAAGLLLDFPSAAAPFGIRLEFAQPRVLYSDPMLLGPSRWIELSCADRVLDVAVEGARARLSLAAGARRLAGLDAARPEAAIPVERQDGLVILPAGGEARAGLAVAAATASCADAAAVRAELGTALDCLLRGAPAHADWIRRMVRCLVPVPGGPGRFASGSARDRPGLVTVSPTGSGARMAESLVHEGAHQYFYLASRLAMLVHDEPGRLYYSPLVACERPLDRILLAYHAAANVLAYYGELQLSGLAPDGSEAGLRHAAADCRALSAHLRCNAGLTPAGRALYEPIAGWLDQRRLL